jgi:UDP-2-acetamido-2,6-beta-L-arabino-hexul-4-ose reductase
MKTILVTGANGFVGRNLITRLQVDKENRVLSFDIDNSEQELRTLLDQAEFVFHLAGVNRPKNEEEFQTGNVDLTAELVDILQKAGKSTPVLITSSIQAAQDNPYGRSKKMAEDKVFVYARQTGAEVFVYRLPNLFGKWSRPNYNSVVSTFCYNISHNLPIQINNPSYLLPLAYIDDVVDEFIGALAGKAHRDEAGFCFVPRTFQITLQELADRIYSFRASRDTAILPDMSDLLTKFLYTTYLSYLDPNGFSYFADMKTDQRGWLFELIKSPHIGQIFVSQTKPGVTRGGHYHHTKVEKFVVVQGEAVIRFRKIDGNEILSYPVSDAKIEIVDIPPGYTHDITNVGSADVITLFWASEIFDPEKPDTYYLQV